LSGFPICRAADQRAIPVCSPVFVLFFSYHPHTAFCIAPLLPVGSPVGLQPSTPSLALGKFGPHTHTPTDLLCLSRAYIRFDLPPLTVFAADYICITLIRTGLRDRLILVFFFSAPSIPCAPFMYAIFRLECPSFSPTMAAAGVSSQFVLSHCSLVA